ncbi:MAG: hypothetical protein U9R75_09180 [Candidatus Thermoplasmatota archaeon]|nr:hypothetical protein [Candidatus Thermoplasmatota archaeon]
MRMKMFSYLTVVIVLMMISPVAFLIITENVNGQDIGGPMILNDTTLHLIEGMQMSPLAPETDEWQAVVIPNGFVRDGFFGYSILPIGHVYWKPVGTWSTEPTRSAINLGGKVTITIFATREEGSGSVNSDFIFKIMRGNEPILQIDKMSCRITEGVDNKIEATGFFRAANDTVIESDTTIQLEVSARCNGGAIMKFGSTTVDSGFTFGSNSLEIIGAKMTKNHVVMEYRDAFMVPWIRLYTQIILNDVIQPNTQRVNERTVNRTMEIHWERDNTPGDYVVETSISYDYTGQQNITGKYNLKVPQQHVSDLQEFKNFMNKYLWVFLLIISIILFPYVTAKWRKRVWRKRFRELQPHDNKLPKSKKKEMWKKMKQTRKTKRKEKRKEEREHREKERDEGKFSLFSKPREEGVRHPKRNTPLIQAEVLSEPDSELEL